MLFRSLQISLKATDLVVIMACVTDYKVAVVAYVSVDDCVLPESVNILIRHQILDEDKAIFLIGDPLVWGQKVIVERVPENGRTCLLISYCCDIRLNQS